MVSKKEKTCQNDYFSEQEFEKYSLKYMAIVFVTIITFFFLKHFIVSSPFFYSVLSFFLSFLISFFFSFDFRERGGDSS